MSTVVMSACWPLSMPPTPKAVLISLADNANDHGECWPSIPTIATRTCFSERAVQNAIKWLEDAGVVTADRSNGRHTRYTLAPAAYAPAQQMHPAAGASEPPQQVRQPPQEIPKPPQQMPSNRKEPSRTVKATVMECPPDVDPVTWGDWLTLRKAKKAPVTETVVKQARVEAGKAGLSLTKFLEIWCARGSQGLQADWLKPNERAGPIQAQQPGKRMQAIMRLEAMKNGLGSSGSNHGDSEALLLGAGPGAGFGTGRGNGSGVG